MLSAWLSGLVAEVVGAVVSMITYHQLLMAHPPGHDWSWRIACSSAAGTHAGPANDYIQTRVGQTVLTLIVMACAQSLQPLWFMDKR